ncbi:unnamed protein product [Trichobilharzia regenti]|nr:unnamed protein product [Trichobilharzia regenti]
MNEQELLQRFKELYRADRLQGESHFMCVCVCV